MKIYNISPISYTAKKIPVSNTELKNTYEKFTKEDFYKQIDGFLHNEYKIDKYLTMFSQGVNKIIEQNSIQEYNSAERQYINNLFAIIDMSENLKSIPDDYFKHNMIELLEKCKK